MFHIHITAYTFWVYHANSGVNRMYSQGRKLTNIKHKCYAKITMQYILKCDIGFSKLRFHWTCWRMLHLFPVSNLLSMIVYEADWSVMLCVSVSSSFCNEMRHATHTYVLLHAKTGLKAWIVIPKEGGAGGPFPSLLWYDNRPESYQKKDRRGSSAQTPSPVPSFGSGSIILKTVRNYLKPQLIFWELVLWYQRGHFKLVSTRFWRKRYRMDPLLLVLQRHNVLA